MAERINPPREFKFRFWRRNPMNGALGTMMYSDSDFFHKGPKIPLWNLGVFFQEAGGHPVMQWTGLKDKTGRDIYEGDIVQISGGYEGAEVEPTKAAVFFKDGAFQTDFHNALIRIALPGNWLVEVVGNIYENPELLEGAANG